MLLAASLGLAGLFAASAQEVVTFEQALARAAAAEPGLDAALAGIEAARAGVDQASRRLNPAIGVEAENFGGDGPLTGVDSLETTASLVQTLELGGDRRARIGVAEGDLAVVQSDAVLRRLDLLRAVQEGYVDAAAAAARRDLAAERLSIAESVRAAVARRVSSALDPAVALSRAELELESARAELDAATAAEQTARVRLAGYWAAGTATDFVVDLDDFYDPGAHALQMDDIAVEDSPDLALVQAAQSRADAVVDLEIARGVQDVDVGAGVRHFNDGSDTAFVAGVSVPLATFDRNRSAIAAARADRTRLSYEAESVRRAVLRDLASGQRERASALTRVDALSQRVIPQAEQALAQAREGYARGAFSSLEVLDAQRAHHDAREALVDALSDYHRADAALDRLTARFAAPLPGEELEP
jgi:cobalt-zinc-cadmium efflux system outer membrane protein